jgi:hypothetical protein
MRVPNIVGGGANTNKYGLHFEQTTSLKTLLESQAGFEVRGDNVYKNGNKVGQLCGKAKIYTDILRAKKIDYTQYISKRLYPDEAILVGNTVYIIEKKFQSGAGSVDEKLQTCDFKKKQYAKLFAPAGLTAEYIYILSDWFRQDCYKDVHEYILDVGCKYYFKDLPLAAIGLSL